jgi:hypothetical protein
MKSPSALELIENFDRLPNDAVVPTVIAAIVLGISEWTVRREHELVHLSTRRLGMRVGRIREIAHGRPAESRPA